MIKLLGRYLFKCIMFFLQYANDHLSLKRKLAVEGVSFASFWDEQDTIDPNTLETNDIAAFLRVYGVEAARSNIIKEMNAVFAGYVWKTSFPTPSLPPLARAN